MGKRIVEIIPPIYDSVYIFLEGMVQVSFGDKEGLYRVAGGTSK
jgi:mannose-6-phosphate isomerase-like protein (cupin superfamily)